ncbi:ABC transporter permease [Cerasicoccus frondis]|uniref:ABC transporter permease n=1 Tax=Cerasicoccus frondis TaxID=490090 RepID=UPI00285287F2|nr:ABC transporter permease [Cerasicoccus frondis]
MAKNAQKTRELATRIFIRDMRAMFRQSILGYLWILLPPIANSLVWIYLNEQQVIQISDERNGAYPIFVLSGNLIWTAFNTTLTGMLATVQESRGLISKIHFPHEALLVATFAKASVNALIPLLLVIPMLPFYVSSFEWQMLLFPLGVFAIMLMGATIAIFLLPIATLYNDTSRGMQLLLRFAFFLTPVVYPLPTSGLAKVISDLNPVTPLLVTTRSWLIGEGPIMLDSFMVLSLIIIPALFIGILIYKISIPYLIERLSA